MNARKDYAKHFDTKKRTDNETRITFLSETAPEELKDFVYDIHRDYFFKSLPNDWIYATISEAFWELRNNDFDLDCICLEPDVYNNDLYNWLGESYGDEYCNEAMQEGLCEGKDIWAIIATGQYIAKRNVFEAVSQFIEQGE